MKILIHGRHFPVAMFRFFDWAFRDLGHEVFSIGPYSAGRIPWGDFYFPEHTFPPNLTTIEASLPIDEVLKHIPFKPDMIFQAADTIYLTGKSPVLNVILATDPHAIDYTDRLKYADLALFMQKCYMPDGAYHIPYAYDDNIHHFLPGTKEVYDVVLSGLQYAHRVEAVNKMREKGLNVLNTLGLIYEDYVHAYNQGKIAFSYSSKNDLPARFWEGLAMKRMVLQSRVPDLEEIDFKDGVDYVGFSSIEEAVEKAVYYSKHDSERIKIAENGYLKVKPHTYKQRCKTILKLVKNL